MILFISHESHRQLIRNFYKVGKNVVSPINTVVNMTAGLSEGTLMYSWGSAAFGKLGLGLSSENDCENVSEFIREDLARVKLNITDSDTYQYFTYAPQPVVSFLGLKVKTVEAGLHHFLALTTAGELFAWGDNSQCQLGLDDPEAFTPPNHFDKNPVKLSIAEKPSSDGAKGGNTSQNNISIKTSQYQGSMAESICTVEEDTHEVIWELEGNPMKPISNAEGPRIDFQQQTRAT